MGPTSLAQNEAKGMIIAVSELEDRINSVLGDPKQLEQITKLAQSLMAGGDTGQDGAPAAPSGGLGDMLKGLAGDGMPDLDPAMLGRLSRIISGGGDKKQERALLDAMRPYMSEKRRSKMDRALRIAKLAGIAKIAMGELGVGGDDKPLSG